MTARGWFDRFQPIGQLRAFTRVLYAGDRIFAAHFWSLRGPRHRHIIVGDRAELETITTTLHNAGASPQTCAIGSVKSLIGHTVAAGVAGLIGRRHGAHHRTLPPHANIGAPLDGRGGKPGLHAQGGAAVAGPSRASAAGGGFRGASASRGQRACGAGGVRRAARPPTHACAAMTARPIGPCELCLHGADVADLTRQIDRLLADPGCGRDPRALADLPIPLLATQP
ncbi:MAG: hypothetical protein R2838_04040 [Caldilineaceae bacterium]